MAVARLAQTSPQRHGPFSSAACSDPQQSPPIAEGANLSPQTPCTGLTSSQAAQLFSSLPPGSLGQVFQIPQPPTQPAQALPSQHNSQGQRVHLPSPNQAATPFSGPVTPWLQHTYLPVQGSHLQPQPAQPQLGYYCLVIPPAGQLVMPQQGEAHCAAPATAAGSMQGAGSY